jgi:hypothetical protein
VRVNMWFSHLSGSHHARNVTGALSRLRRRVQ